MVLDRQYQNELLNFLSQDYPEYEHAHEHCQELYITDRLKYIGNVDYLQQHGLLRDGVLLRHGVDGTTSVGVTPFPTITEKGIDFVAQDGGLSAILNVQTVKIHPDTIKALVEARLLSSSLDPQQKTSLVDQLKKLPEESVKRLLDKLLDMGIQAALSSASGLFGLL